MLEKDFVFIPAVQSTRLSTEIVDRCKGGEITLS